MLRQIFAASAMTIAAPALAQTAQVPAPTAPTVAPGTASVPKQAAPAGEIPAATTTDQVSTIVNAEFAAYDRDGNGLLEKAEFAAWMDALKARAPAGGDKPGDAEWNEAAFAKADKDESRALTRGELTDFLGTSLKSSAG